MAPELFNRPVFRRFYAGRFSIIGWIDLIFLALELVCPFIILFSMPNFWIREKHFNEQPVVMPTNQWAVILSDGTNEYLDTSITSLSLLNPTIGVSTFFSESIYDADLDNRIDFLDINARICVSPLPPTPWTSATLVYFPKVRFINNLKLSTDAPIILTYQGDGATAITAEGQLSFTSLKPLPMYTPFNNTPFVNTSAAVTTNIFSPEYIQKRLTTDSVAASFTPSTTPIITHTATPTSCFSFHGIVNISPQRIRYVPGFWETIKHAWVEFFAVFCLCYLVLNRIERYIFDHQLLSTLVKDDEIPSVMAQNQATSFTSYLHAVEHPHHM
ncbi:putative transmembrane protein 231 [Blattamonas nauphoetae]|uniref:Transmembrane protein 231 n=1 Tax=Blattamonas nauphoetae TaxID=2049346 RepID=A0ABQ9X687_9EUKA|nr:putative transmembrane protein 231 [Blattamonas nauphoetae]